MSSAVEQFIIELARSSGHALRVLDRVPARARSDVLAAGITNAWERRAEYEPPQLPEIWFGKFLRAAAREWRKGERGLVDITALDETVPDETSALAEMQSEIEHAINLRGPAVAEAMSELIAGRANRDVERSYGRHTYELARKVAGKLERQLRNPRIAQRLLRAHTTEPDNKRLAKIDHEIARIDFPPHERAECPVCWRCMYFYGYLPTGKHEARMKIVEPDIGEAIAATEKRKMQIAEQSSRT